MSCATAFLQSPARGILPLWHEGCCGSTGMALKRIEASWVTKLPAALQAHARRFVHLVGLDGLREIAGALPSAQARGRPAINREADLIAVLTVNLTEPESKFQEVARRMVTDGILKPVDLVGKPIKKMGDGTLADGFARDLNRRLNDARKADPDFERRIAERLAGEGRIVRDDLFPDIFARQMKQLSKLWMPKASMLHPYLTEDLAAKHQASLHSMQATAARSELFREAFRDILPEKMTVRQFFDCYLAAREFIRADIKMRKEKED
jgi:hypothetical protein